MSELQEGCKEILQPTAGCIIIILALRNGRLGKSIDQTKKKLMSLLATGEPVPEPNDEPIHDCSAATGSSRSTTRRGSTAGFGQSTTGFATRRSVAAQIGLLHHRIFH
jgi:hypothetical protein